MDSYSLAIIAGGASSRMGTDKAFVTIDGKPLIQHVLERTQDLNQAETILITNRPNEYAHLGLPMYSDVIPGKGSLGGIYTAIHYSKSPYILTLACDMPFVSTSLLKFMLSKLQDIKPTPDVIVPRVEGYPQGLHAIYEKNCLNPIKEKIETNQLKVIGFYPLVNVHYLDEVDYKKYTATPYAFFNVNTPEQLKEAREYVHHEREK